MTLKSNPEALHISYEFVACLWWNFFVPCYMRLKEIRWRLVLAGGWFIQVRCDNSPTSISRIQTVLSVGPIRFLLIRGLFLPLLVPGSVLCPHILFLREIRKKKQTKKTHRVTSSLPSFLTTHSLASSVKIQGLPASLWGLLCPLSLMREHCTQCDLRIGAGARLDQCVEHLALCASARITGGESKNTLAGILGLKFLEKD